MHLHVTCVLPCISLPGKVLFDYVPERGGDFRASLLAFETRKVP